MLCLLTRWILKRVRSLQWKLRWPRWRAIQTYLWLKKKISQSMALAICTEQRIQPREFMDSLLPKTSVTKAWIIINTKMLIQKREKLQKHLRYILCLKLANSILALKLDSLHRLNCQILKHPVAKRTVQELMPQPKITTVIYRLLSRTHMLVVGAMTVNLTSTMEIQKSTTILVHSSDNSKVQGSVVHWKALPTISKWCHSRSLSEQKSQAYQDRTRMVGAR